MYARFRSRSVFYQVKPTVKAAYGVTPNRMRSLSIKPELLRGSFADETVDLREKQRLDMLESLRHPRERDFYQDHTYHNQWIQREMEPDQKKQIAGRYRFMSPNYQIKPWVWFPGDMVEVTSGESRGQRGTIIAVLQYKNELIVQNINVQDVVIPATETRPEQIVQREHPISVRTIRHVDPTTNELCDVRLVTVRNKETGKLEEKRISMSSGVLMPIPPRDEAIEVGDPLRDTPFQDADELTYDAEAELSVLVERKLRAMEEHFVQRLKLSHEYHHALAARNEADMRQFQLDVVERATMEAVDAVHASMQSDWWAEETAPLVDEMRAVEAERAALAAAAAQSSGETLDSNPAAAADDQDDEAEEAEEMDDEALLEDVTTSGASDSEAHLSETTRQPSYGDAPSDRR